MDIPEELKIALPTYIIAFTWVVLATSLIRSWGPMPSDVARVVIGGLLLSTFIVSILSIKTVEYLLSRGD